MSNLHRIMMVFFVVVVVDMQVKGTCLVLFIITTCSKGRHFSKQGQVVLISVKIEFYH